MNWQDEMYRKRVEELEGRGRGYDQARRIAEADVYGAEPSMKRMRAAAKQWQEDQRRAWEVSPAGRLHQDSKTWNRYKDVPAMQGNANTNQPYQVRERRQRMELEQARARDAPYEFIQNLHRRHAAESRHASENANRW